MYKGTLTNTRLPSHLCSRWSNALYCCSHTRGGMTCVLPRRVRSAAGVQHGDGFEPTLRSMLRSMLRSVCPDTRRTQGCAQLKRYTPLTQDRYYVACYVGFAPAAR